MQLYGFQKEVLTESKDKNKVAYYYDMGLGKTFVGSEKAVSLNKNILLICQKSKIDDWVKHFIDNYHNYSINICNLSIHKNLSDFLAEGLRNQGINWDYSVWVINYELAFRRPELLELKDFTLILDESSLIQNEQAKRTKFIMRLHFSNLILLSGTPTGGKYEKLYSQMRLLGWDISKNMFWREFIIYRIDEYNGFPVKTVTGYKNVERLKEKMREYGCYFKKTSEVFDLPEQVFQNTYCRKIREYDQFRKNGIVKLGNNTFVGDTTLTKLLTERILCGIHNPSKIGLLKDLLLATDDRVIVFYNFNCELKVIEDLCIELDKPTAIINGSVKDLSCYEQYNNSITLVQYQAGAMGLNLQKANKIIYFTPTLSSELYEQSKKRIHRIGQDKTCFYYPLIVKNTVEEKIYNALALRKDYTNALFEQGE